MTDAATIISALRALANDIQSPDGVANASIREAADRLEELDNTITAMVEVDGVQIKRLRAHNAELQRYNVGLAEENCKLRRELESVRLRDSERDARVIEEAANQVCSEIGCEHPDEYYDSAFRDYANQLRRRVKEGA